MKNKYKKYILSAGIILSISAFSFTASASNINEISELSDFLLQKSDYYSPDMDLNNDGNINIFDLTLAKYYYSAPLRSITVSNTDEIISALKNASAGDEIILKSGVYENDKWVGVWAVFASSAEGTKEHPIILRSEDPENPAVLKGVNPENKMGLYITGDYWKIENIAVSTAHKGIVLDNSNFSVISNCEVYNTGSEGIHLRDNSSDCIIDSCYIHDTGVISAGFGEGVYIGSAKSTTDYGYKCDNNIIKNCSFGPNIASEHIDIKEYTTGTIIESCTFDGTGISGANYADSFVDIKGNNVIVRNNTGYRNQNENITIAFQVGVQVEGWGQENEIYNNTVYMDTEKGYVVNGWDSSATVYENIRIPDGEMYYGNLITEK
ncbi:MAG: right-handed parallel beta-helix repeat-containing protein [Ruminococcus sp.]|nr:right-handed parallel beta-helix repeat-containing protein [Ruminococcus sp.]